MHGRTWDALERHREALGDVRLEELFGRDTGRMRGFVRQACGLHVDFSKHLVDERALDLLVALAEERELQGWRKALFDGAPVNGTEGRAALHTALRNRSERPVRVQGHDVMPEVRAVLTAMRAFVDDVRRGTWRGFTGEPIRDVVNIGIGGSDLGPAMAAAALEAYGSESLRCHHVSNLDGAQLALVLQHLDPRTTLFVVASKTFSTQETLTNARSARAWVVEALGDEAAVARHFVAVSTHAERVRAFGIDTRNMFGFWDWVGGRYSLWSAVGLSVALLTGMDVFERLLDGAYAMDEHFRSAPLRDNLPVILGLLGLWYTDFFGASTHAVLPYDWALRLLPAHLQQLEMESNGKRVTRDGAPIPVATCPIVWGGPGNNGQHAFYQLLHQGTRLVPADFLVARESQFPLPGHQPAVLANALAQTEALMRGRTEHEAYEELREQGISDEEARRLAPHKAMPGNRPTTMILYERLTPEILGALVALYEHKVFVQSVIWRDNAFDQWGVELGKKLAGRILEELRGGARQPHDPSTEAAIGWARGGEPAPG